MPNGKANSLLAAVAFALVLGGCHQGQVKSRTEIIWDDAEEKSDNADSMVGKTKAELLETFGAPDSVLKLDDATTVYKYRIDHGTLRRKRFIVGRQTNTLRIKFDAFLKNDIVTMVHNDGVEEVKK